jgi:hypothetical protein
MRRRLPPNVERNVVIKRDHVHRAVAGLTKERIEEKILKPLANRPGAKIDTLKKFRILIRHAKDDLKWLDRDPSDGIKPGKSKEIRAWTDAEMKAFEDRWAFGTRQRAAYEMMLNVGTARIDTHLTTWVQADADDFEYTRRKTGVSVLVNKAQSLRAALAALPHKHVCILTTDWGQAVHGRRLQRMDARCEGRPGYRPIAGHMAFARPSGAFSQTLARQPTRSWPHSAT